MSLISVSFLINATVQGLVQFGCFCKSPSSAVEKIGNVFFRERFYTPCFLAEYFEWCLSEDKVVEKLHKKIKIKTNIIGGIIVSSSYVYSWCFDTPEVSISCYRSSPSAISLASSFPVTHRPELRHPMLINSSSRCRHLQVFDRLAQLVKNRNRCFR